MPRVLVLLATIPARRQSCDRLLKELTLQKRVPDGIILVLDGYGDAAAPTSTIPVIAEHRTEKPRGAGARWSVLENLPPDDIVVCVDDDTMLVEAPLFVSRLAEAVEHTNGAAAAMGRGTDYKHAPPGKYSRGDLIYGAGMGLTIRVKHLVGLQDFADAVKAMGGPDALGYLGDDDALVSAFLWKKGVKIRHATTGNVFGAPGTKASSQTAARMAKHEKLDAQKQAIQKAIGWPWERVAPVAHQR